MMLTIDKINKKKNGIYLIQSLIDDRIYIGSATNFYKRYGRHISSLRNNKHHNRKLQNFFNKYGESSLSFHMICIVEDKVDLLPMEQYYIDLLCPYIDGFNIVEEVGDMSHIPKETRIKNGINRRGVKLSEQWKRHISEAKKKEYAENGHHYTGKTLPKYWTDHMSEANQKRVQEGRNVMVERFKSGQYNGENHPKSKITNDIALQIKQDIAIGIKRLITIAKYGITLHMYKDIQRGKTWSHIKVGNHENTHQEG